MPFKWVKSFFFSKYKPNFGHFWPKNGHLELYFLIKYSLNQLKLSYPPIWYARRHIYINFFLFEMHKWLNWVFLPLKWPIFNSTVAIFAWKWPLTKMSILKWEITLKCRYEHFELGIYHFWFIFYSQVTFAPNFLKMSVPK